MVCSIVLKRKERRKETEMFKQSIKKVIVFHFEW